MAHDKITQSYRDGKLNEYMYDKLLKSTEIGAGEALVEELVQDAKDASDLGVSNDKEYNLYFFTSHLVDDLLKDTFGLALDDVRKKDLKYYIFSHKDDGSYKFNNLIDFRILIYDWLCNSLNKKAYPNIAGKTDMEPIYDVDKWIATLKKIYTFVREGQPHDTSVKYFTQNWDSDERQHFINWLKYYEGKNMEKYNVKNAKLTKQADFDFAIPQSWSKEDSRPNTAPISTIKIDKEKTRREKELEQARILKMKMRGRLLSFKKLLDKYNDILPKQNLDNIYVEINNLDRNINRLDVYASVQDCIFRSAGRLRKFGFSEGAEMLESIAEDKNVMQSIPTGISDKPNLPAGAQAISIRAIIDRLEGVSKALKSRDMVRELASIDILLNELGLASYFPDLGFSQAKLIEAFGYSSTKIEDIIAKLRGSGKAPTPKAPEVKTQPIQSPVPPSKPIDTGEIMSKPIGEVRQELPKETPKKTE